jgi:hypothetical protein
MIRAVVTCPHHGGGKRTDAVAPLSVWYFGAICNLHLCNVHIDPREGGAPCP